MAQSGVIKRPKKFPKSIALWIALAPFVKKMLNLSQSTLTMA